MGIELCLYCAATTLHGRAVKTRVREPFRSNSPTLGIRMA